MANCPILNQLAGKKCEPGTPILYISPQQNQCCCCHHQCNHSSPIVLTVPHMLTAQAPPFGGTTHTKSPKMATKSLTLPALHVGDHKRTKDFTIKIVLTPPAQTQNTGVKGTTGFDNPVLNVVAGPAVPGPIGSSRTLTVEPVGPTTSQATGPCSQRPSSTLADSRFEQVPFHSTGISPAASSRGRERSNYDQNTTDVALSHLLELKRDFLENIVLATNTKMLLDDPRSIERSYTEMQDAYAHYKLCALIALEKYTAEFNNLRERRPSVAADLTQLSDAKSDVDILVEVSTDQDESVFGSSQFSSENSGTFELPSYSKLHLHIHELTGSQFGDLQRSYQRADELAKVLFPDGPKPEQPREMMASFFQHIRNLKNHYLVLQEAMTRNEN